jgi:cytochrome c oxidase assembly protein subunit 15
VLGRLSVATALLMYVLIVIGSVVRTTGSGLACPDWPLCHGRLIPPLEFHVLIEWFHRLVALLVSAMVFATAGWTLAHGATRARLGGFAVLAVALLLAQVVLGALTVWKLLSPSIVSSHLAVALLLFATLLTISLIAASEASPASRFASDERPAGVLPLFGVATLLTYAQAVLGGLVSTNHAGLACPDWPTCDGQWFPPMEGLVGLQMMHRYGAYTLVLVMIAVAVRARTVPDGAIRAGGSLALSLTLTQVVLGVCNVLLGTPAWLSAAHLATAAAILAVLVITTWRVARLPGRILELAAEGAR